MCTIEGDIEHLFRGHSPPDESIQAYSLQQGRRIASKITNSSIDDDDVNLTANNAFDCLDAKTLCHVSILIEEFNAALVNRIKLSKRQREDCSGLIPAVNVCLICILMYIPTYL